MSCPCTLSVSQVGLNAYLTPKGTQGLAPHHDEVEQPKPTIHIESIISGIRECPGVVDRLVDNRSMRSPRCDCQAWCVLCLQVELWVIQTGGTKAWKIYSPIKGFQLPNTASGDLKQVRGLPWRSWICTCCVGTRRHSERGGCVMCLNRRSDNHLVSNCL